MLHTPERNDMTDITAQELAVTAARLAAEAGRLQFAASNKTTVPDLDLKHIAETMTDAVDAMLRCIPSTSIGLGDVDDLSKEITEDFVGAFTKDENYGDAMACLVEQGILPNGVDPEDPRVKAIVQRCRDTALSKGIKP